MKRFGEKLAGVDYARRPGSYGVLLESERVGVVKSAEYGDYFLIGGGIDAGETAVEALRREAREEIGFEIEIGEQIGAADEYFYSSGEKKYTVKECRFYRISLARRAARPGKHRLRWITREELDRMHHESYRWIVEQELNKS